MAEAAAAPGVRAARALLLAALVVLLGALSHEAGGGTVSAPAVVVSLLVVSLFVTGLVRRTPGPRSGMALLGLGQLVMHAVFSTVAAGRGIAPAPTGHGAHADAALPVGPVDLHVGGADPWAMAASHVAAAAVLGVVLSASERYVWRLAARLVGATTAAAAVVSRLVVRVVALVAAITAGELPRPLTRTSPCLPVLPPATRRAASLLIGRGPPLPH